MTCIPVPEGPAVSPEHPIISLRDVSASYPGGAAPVLHGMSLDIAAGEHVCILGGNGSGKSALVQLMNALLLPGAGSVRVASIDPLEGMDAVQRIRAQAAMVFQHPEDQMVTSIVADDVAFGPQNLGLPQPEIARRVKTALRAVGMDELAQADPADLSGGQRQRVAIAGALAMEPRILLLDEPTALLDPEGARAVRSIVAHLHERGITVVHVTHAAADALAADRAIVLQRGRVVFDGSPHALYRDTDRLRTWDLEVPFALDLAERLQQQGLPVPRTTDSEELADTVSGWMNDADATGRSDVERALGVSASPRSADDGAPAMGRASAVSQGPSPAAGTALDPCEPAVVCTDVSFSYADARPARKPARRRLRARHTDAAAPLAVRDLTFHLAPGTVTALIGRTGSGKSTVAELVCALKLPRTGTVSVAGIDTADRADRRALRARVGYVAQLPERQLFAPTVYEDVAFGPRNLGLNEEQVAERVRRALAAVGLDPTDDLLARAPFALSGGEQRRVGLAGVLAMDQAVLVLDEPLAGLDAPGRARMCALLEQLKAQGATLLIATHNMDETACCDQVLALDCGRIVACDAPEQVLRDPCIVCRASGNATPRGDLAPGGTAFEEPEPCTSPAGMAASATPAAAAPALDTPHTLGFNPPAPFAFADLLAQRGIRLAQAPRTIDELVCEVIRGGVAR